MNKSSLDVAPLAWLAVCLLPALAQAASPPPPGFDAVGPLVRDQLLRDERLDSRQMEESAPVVEREDEEPAAAEDGPSFVLKSVRFTPSGYLSETQLRAVVEPYLDTSVTFTDLSRMVEQVNDLYRKMGVYTALALLPKQKVEDGVVLVRLVEGRLGKLLIEQNAYTGTDYIRGWISQQDHEKTVDVLDLEGDILAYNRVNDQRLRAELRAGTAFGLTDIVVIAEEPKRDSVQAFVDNYGYESNGQWELGVLYRRQQAFIDGDRAIVYVQGSEGTLSASLGYNAPIDNSRWRVGATATFTQTKVVDGPSEPFDIEGESNRLALEASWLALSRQRYWVNGLFSLSTASSDTTIAGADLSQFVVDTLGAGVQFNWMGDVWQVNARQFVNLADSQDQLAGKGGAADLSAEYLLYPGDLTVIARQGRGGFYALTQAGWQQSGDEALAGTVAWTAGGPTSVRGYPSGAVTGDTGYYMQLEQHYNGWTLGGNSTDFYLFYDIGQADTGTTSQSLSATGVGASLGLGRRFSLDLSVALPLEDDVLPDQDDTQFWLRLSGQF